MTSVKNATPKAGAEPRSSGAHGDDKARELTASDRVGTEISLRVVRGLALLALGALVSLGPDSLDSVSSAVATAGSFASGVGARLAFSSACSVLGGRTEGEPATCELCPPR